jgi:hypothetical protein
LLIRAIQYNCEPEQYNTILEEIKEKIKGNKVFYANQKMLQSKLLSRKSK